VWHVREIYAGFERAWPAYRRLLLGAAAVPCVSEACAAQFGGAARVSVILDGLALPAHDTLAASRPTSRAALELPLDVPVIAVLGRISTWKGQDVLLRALADPELRSTGAVAVIAGDTWPGAEARLAALRRLAVSLGVDDRVRWVGFRDDVTALYGAADLIAVPSTAPDPLPGAAVEAAAAGCAVLASDHGGLPEILRDGVTGRLFPAGDVQAFARAARELLLDPDERARLGAAAARDVRERFAPARLLAEVQGLYDEVLA
jgi:glycosyltransferase involved in cell wall biosynthesis